MEARKPLSKKVRFDVFKRDSFTCQYCGSTPPAVVLEVDHITPVYEGGKNGMDNLVCACFDCNRGKGATELSVVPLTVTEKAERLREAEEQLKAYNKLLASKRKRLEKEKWEVAEIMTPGCSASGFNRLQLISIKQFIEKLGLEETMLSMERAVQKKPQRSYQTFQYFCGICWNKIKSAQDG